ncbi:carbon storage regulator CsrA [Desulfosporosinus sp. BICA1-9]|uniref:carbon storage regulator CsrA n=1 Tax=Desulfosporosinus sp. BICA1-9 TaxID=1531958 RepID=UPI00054B0323|nr:carbon storage regulator CsrA [Desulfosporosinus sp. BICA1-9]KJS50238.1 MAG: carbon storage regulator [Peptococcaceae bacterium BRH_c23]KJS86774.1 MAG: carbon storage regulator [Desulfosporosinus sp. BICA1-9]HBW36482.1 carbon storage regulator [Desulfosporosinus sp.]
MLALTRKVGERIVIGDNIVVTLISIKGDNIRLAIEAPKVVKIYRGEIFDAIAAENRQAAVPNDLTELDKLKEMQIKK